MRLVLSSNSSFRYHPENTLTTFSVQLSSTLDLSNNQYECALSEIQFYKSWYNVPNTWVIIRNKNTNQNYKIYVYEGYYNTLEQLISTINDRIEYVCGSKIANDVKFCVDAPSKKTFVSKLMRHGYTVELDSELSIILGFDEICLQNLGSNEYELTPNLSIYDESKLHFYSSDSDRLKALYNIFVYTDAIQPSIVSDIEAPLLRVVPVSDESHWTYQTSTFTKPQYLPLAQKHLRSITIYLKDSQGNPILFNNGQTIITLEIRKVNNSLAFR